MLPNIINDIERDLSVEQVLEYYRQSRAKSQTSKTETLWFCPLSRCKAGDAPHFAVYERDAVDAYGKPIDFSRHVNQDTVVRKRWRCRVTGREGYGPISLVAAVNGLPTRHDMLSRDEWVRIIRICAEEILHRPAPELEDDARNGYLLNYRDALPSWKLFLSDTFTPQALTTLALNGYEEVPVRFMVEQLHREFGLWQVEKYIMASRREYGKDVSHERRAHALFPMFALCYDYETGKPLKENPEKREDRYVARIIMPAFNYEKGEDFEWKNDFWVVVNGDNPAEDLKAWKHRNQVFGDNVAMMMLDKDRDAVAICGSQEMVEQLVTTEEYEYEETDDKGKKKKEIRTREIEDRMKIRLTNCVLCKDPLNAVTTFMWLNYPRFHAWIRVKEDDNDYEYNIYSNNFWHVAFLLSSRKDVESYHAGRLQRIAGNLFLLFGNDRSELAKACNNAMANNFLRLTMLPERLGNVRDMDRGDDNDVRSVDSGLGKFHIPHSPQDYFRYYRLSTSERTGNSFEGGTECGIKSNLLKGLLLKSAPFFPFEKVAKKKTRPGELGYNYEVNLNVAWQMLASKGYCRALDPKRPDDKIGSCYQVNGRFISAVENKSVLSKLREILAEFATNYNNRRNSVQEFDLMANAIKRCKGLQNEADIANGLPEIVLPTCESYNESLDYFFFKNGALEITPTSVRFRQYSELNFLIYESQILPFSYVSPLQSGRSPISMGESKAYLAKKEEVRKAEADSGFDSGRLYELKRELFDLESTGRWYVDVQPSEQVVDSRISVPLRIASDTKHNQWLRWWPFLRVLRCFANEDWEREEAGDFGDVDREVLMSRLANLMFTIGRCIFRYRGGVQYMPYFLENSVSKEGKAQGGSGKSFLINCFVPFVRNVCVVDARNLHSNDFANNFAKFQFHYHDVIHLDDMCKGGFESLYNYATGDFDLRKKYQDNVSISRAEAPNIVITSNYMVQSLDDSTLGRVQFGGMSRYFRRDIIETKQQGRGLDTVFPTDGFNLDAKPQDYPVEIRSQIIYTLAKCLQFCMVVTAARSRVGVPGTNLLVRLSRTELGDTFFDWATNFFEKAYIYNVPIAIEEIFSDYRKYLDPSKARVDNVSRAKFYDNLRKYCAKPANGVLFMPIKPFLSDTDKNRSKKKGGDGTEMSYLRRGSSWLTRAFLDENDNLRHARVLSKNAGDRCATGGAVWFSRVGEEPKSREDMERMIEAFLVAPDPEPVLDENDRPITEAQWSRWRMLNTAEEAEALRKAGATSRRSAPASASAAAANSGDGSDPITGEAKTDDLPF